MDLRKPMLAALAPCAMLLLLEIAFRIGGFPHGYFAGVFPPAEGQYPKNAEMRMTWGPIPYVVHSNNLGLRGPDITLEKKEHTVRIATIGDSITDGFFVDNEHTWQHYLTEILNDSSGIPQEVVNCARGGGSIDVAFFQFSEHALPLDPDVVILTFVSNDIFEILDRSEEELLHYQRRANLQFRASLRRFLLTKTALGEAIYDAYLFVRFRSYRKKRSMMKRPAEERYKLSGALEFRRNAEFFLDFFGKMDKIVLGDAFDDQTARAIDRYVAVLGKMSEVCREEKIRLIFVYFPAYSQIYIPDSSLLINETFREACERLDVGFLDLTPGFREAAKRGEALHLVPVDFHPNPAGNRVFAQVLGDYLKKGESGSASLFPRKPG